MEYLYSLTIDKNLVPFARELNARYDLNINTMYPTLYDDSPQKQERRVKGFLKAIWDSKIAPLPEAQRREILHLAQYYGITSEDFR